MSKERKRIGSLIVVLVAALTLPALALAQRPGGAGSGGPQHPLGRILRQIDLSDEQQTRIHEILFENRETRREHLQQLREARQALRQAVQATEVDEVAIRAAAERVARLQADRAVARAQVLGQVRQALEPAQLERFNELLAQAPDRAGRRGRFPRCEAGRGFGPGPADL